MLYSNSYYECSYDKIDIDEVGLSHLQILDNIYFLKYFETKNDQNDQFILISWFRILFS